MAEKSYDIIVKHMKDFGFVFQGSEIYGGLSNTWDYGPLGVELKDNLKRAWWQRFIQESPNNVGIQSAILMNPKVWEASGHLANFSDPLMDCKNCKTRHRADKLIEDFSNGEVNPGGWSNEEMENFIRDNKIECPKCGSHDFTPIRQFNLMFKTFQGVIEDNTSAIYLRPETAQGMFINFKNVQRSMRRKLPFGIGQVGKSFRNEITPGNFIFRTREFEQMELQFFVKPGEDMEWYEYYLDYCMKFLSDIGVKEENLRLRAHTQEELAHYSKGTSDIEYNFSEPIGWGEIWGISNRTDFDLKRHQDVSKKDLTYHDPMTNEKYIPYVIEPSVGVERMMLAVMYDAYDVEQLEDGDERIVLRFAASVAPIKACVMPLSKKLSDEGMEVFHKLAKHFACEYDEAGTIGKRYRRQDAVGTPFCITVDFDTANDGCVTVRDRDTMEQERIAIDELVSYLNEKIEL